MSLSGVILAAGESRRMGSPKALLEFGGETFLDRLIVALAPVCSPVLVVLGYEAGRIRAGLSQAARAGFVLNPDYRRGQLSSLQTALAAVPAEADGVIFTPVDFPAVLPSTVALLARRFGERRPGELLFIPRFRGGHGHPVCAARALIPEFLALPAGAQARQVIHGHKDHTVFIDVDDPGVLEDIDDPASFERLKAKSSPPNQTGG
jgi:molybdenum cofactor cytidylyltransferase